MEKKRMVALHDADSMIYVVAHKFRVREESLPVFEELNAEEKAKLKEELIQQLYESMDVKEVLDHLDSFVKDILLKVGATEYLGFLGAREGSHTFRHDLAKTKPYKGNRGSSPHSTKFWKPIMVDHLIKKWGYVELFNIEADDACTIFQTIYGDESIICSPDKDLKQIKGWNYNYNKIVKTYVTQQEADYNLHYQYLVGDSTDNITGCKGVGKNEKPMKDENGVNIKDSRGCNVYYIPTNADGVPTAGAPKVLYGLKTAEEMERAVLEMYAKKHGMGYKEYFTEQKSLIYMLREHTDETKDLKPVPYLATSTYTVEQPKKEFPSLKCMQ